MAILTALAPSAHAAGVAAAMPPRADVDTLLARVDRDRLYERPQWRALLHFEPSRFGRRPRSRAETPAFFLAPDGHRDARAELRATLRAFFDPDAAIRDDEHPQCVFIARRTWLERALGLERGALHTIVCPAYEAWRTDLDARGLTLVFPEGFMNNPASLFGHTLLRIDSRASDDGAGLLGYSVDFTAHTGSERGARFIAKGLLGLYPGFFQVRPYYQHLKRYADWENRDIWEYRLDITPDELDFILMHLWELDDVQFPYYFFTKNCSYELLRLLEIGVRDLDASSQFRGAVIPIDTVRALAAEDAFTPAPAHYRPSPETRLRTARRILTRRDRRVVDDVVAGDLEPDDPSITTRPAADRARLLDVAYEQLRYGFLAGHVNEEDSRGLSRRLLLARSQIRDPAVTGDSIPIERPTIQPDAGHASARFSIAAGWRDDEPYVDLLLRPAFHGLLDDDGGHGRHMEIRILDTRMRIYPDDGRVRLQELTLLAASSLTPRSRVFRPLAWTLATGLRTRRVPDGDEFDDAPVWGTELAAGLALDPADPVLLYALADVRLDVGPDLDDDASAGPGGRLGVYLGRRGAPLKAHVFGTATRFALGDTTTWLRGGAELRLSTSRNTAVVLEGTAERLHDETWLSGGVRIDLHF